ncbi:MAG: hypothetical protein LC672_01265, partial [Acidobacteria bacterium]|nr:hypothetical protein [Acidobacteriota bacterium]
EVRKTIASGERGVVQFPSYWRDSRVASVARSALSPARVAAQQAHAPDRGHEGCYVNQRGRAAGDARR